VEAKQQILKAIEELPDGAGVEDALDRLYLLYKVERVLRQADRGELLSQEEVRRQYGEMGQVRWRARAVDDLEAMCLFIARDAAQPGAIFADRVLATTAL
jgi:hypothetical protein